MLCAPSRWRRSQYSWNQPTWPISQIGGSRKCAFWPSICESAEPWRSSSSTLRASTSERSRSSAAVRMMSVGNDRRETPSLAFELEGDLHLCPVGFHLAVLELQIQLGHLRDPEIAESLSRSLDGCGRRLLPRLIASPDPLDALLDALRHGGSCPGTSLSHIPRPRTPTLKA